MIRAIDIVKTFEDGITVLNHVDATFEDGKVNMIIGQSKTVLLKSLIGIHTITSGRIEYDGRNLPDMKEHEVRMLHREVGVLFQGSALFDSMTVLENVLFPLRMFGKMSQSEMEERARFCLKRVQIAEHALEDLRRYAEARRYRPCHCAQPEIPVLRRTELGTRSANFTRDRQTDSGHYAGV